MIPVPSGMRIWLAVGRTDMRRGMNTLALQVQETLGRDPHAGDLYVFRGANTALSTQIFRNATQPFPGAQARAWGAALTLIVLVVMLTILARLVTKRFSVPLR